jgi:hypothetical protein
MPRPFTIEERDRARERILAMARADRRVRAGAVVGSAAAGTDDRWSDLDLTFGLAEGASPKEMLDEWTPELVREFAAVPLFDLAREGSLYRVFLFPGNLQVDLSFTAGFVAQYGPRFRLLFGEEARRVPLPVRAPSEMFGYAVHHAVRARFCIERARPWQAEYWVSGVRDEALALGCHRRGLEVAFGRGYDRLPRDLLALAAEALVRFPARDELLRALGRSVELLLGETDEVRPVALPLAECLRELARPDWA